MTKKQPQCSYCNRKVCFHGDLTNTPDFCPSKEYADLLEETKKKLQGPDNVRMAQDVARTWKEYGKLTRVEETLEYARLQGHKKIGLAFCVGLSEEARLFTNVLLNAGFYVVSVCCMCGALSADDVNLPEDDKIIPVFGNPCAIPLARPPSWMKKDVTCT